MPLPCARAAHFFAHGLHFFAFVAHGRTGSTSLPQTRPITKFLYSIAQHTPACAYLQAKLSRKTTNNRRGFPTRKLADHSLTNRTARHRYQPSQLESRLHYNNHLLRPHRCKTGREPRHHLMMRGFNFPVGTGFASSCIARAVRHTDLLNVNTHF